MFDLFNEPYPDRATGNRTQAWTCWRVGSTPTPYGTRLRSLR